MSFVMNEKLAMVNETMAQTFSPKLRWDLFVLLKQKQKTPRLKQQKACFFLFINLYPCIYFLSLEK